MATNLDTPIGNVWLLRDLRELAKTHFFRKKGFTCYINILREHNHPEYYDIPLHLEIKQLKEVVEVIKRNVKKANQNTSIWDENLCTTNLVLDSIEEYLEDKDLLRKIKYENKS